MTSDTATAAVGSKTARTPRASKPRERKLKAVKDKPKAVKAPKVPKTPKAKKPKAAAAPKPERRFKVLVSKIEGPLARKMEDKTTNNQNAIIMQVLTEAGDAVTLPALIKGVEATERYIIKSKKHTIAKSVNRGLFDLIKNGVVHEYAKDE